MYIHATITIEEEIIDLGEGRQEELEGKGQGASDGGLMLIYEVLKKNKIVKLTNKKNPRF